MQLAFESDQLIEEIDAMVDTVTQIEKSLHELTAPEDLDVIATESLALLGERHLVNTQKSALTPVLRYQLAQEGFADKLKEMINKIIKKLIAGLKWIYQQLFPLRAFKESAKQFYKCEEDVKVAFLRLNVGNFNGFMESLSKEKAQAMKRQLNGVELASLDFNSVVKFEELSSRLNAVFNDRSLISEIVRTLDNNGKELEFRKDEQLLAMKRHTDIIRNRQIDARNSVQNAISDKSSFFDDGISVTSYNDWTGKVTDRLVKTDALMSSTQAVIEDVKKLETALSRYEKNNNFEPTKDMVDYVRAVAEFSTLLMSSLVMVERFIKARFSVSAKLSTILLDVAKTLPELASIKVDKEAHAQLVDDLTKITVRMKAASI